MSCEAPIGIFDSGVGGLTVAKEIMQQLPKEKLIYFGDTARVPYGSKSKETVTAYSRQIIKLGHGCSYTSNFGFMAFKRVGYNPLRIVASVPITPILRYICGLQKQDIDTLVLGCTHYPLLRP